MNRLTCLIQSKDDKHQVLSPAVGYFTLAREAGDILSGGSLIGTLRIMNSYHELYLPKNIQGKLILDAGNDKILPVEYGGELALVDPGFAEGLLDGNATVTQPGEPIKIEEEEGFLVTAFTTGIFYSKPSPDAPPFVDLGERVEKGKALGLIEVMKTFNHIIFHGTDNSDRGTIKKIYVEDAEEVKSGQPLFLIG